MPSVVWPSYGCGQPPTFFETATFKNWLISGNILGGGATTGGWLFVNAGSGCKHICNNTATANVVAGQNRTNSELVAEHNNTATTVNASLDVEKMELWLTIGGTELVRSRTPVLAANAVDFFGQSRPTGGLVVAGPFESLVPGKENVFKLWPIYSQNKL